MNNLCKEAVKQEFDCSNCCFYCDIKAVCEDVCLELKDDCPDLLQEQTGLQIMESAIPDVLHTFTEMTIQMKKLEEASKALRAKIVETMEANRIDAFETDNVSFTYIAPTVRSSIDSAKLKKKYPEIADECTKASKVSASVRIKVK